MLRIMSTVKPYVHIPAEEYNKKDFHSYFNKVYKTIDRKAVKKKSDDFLKEEISTLHYLDKDVHNLIKASGISHKVAHISTSLANYTFLADANLICYLHDQLIHICYAKDGQFKLYNQYHCESAEDYLYFILWVMDYFKLDPETEPLLIGGMVNEDSPIMNILKAYVRNIKLIDQNINLPKEGVSSKQYYYDLFLCKSCV